MTQTLKRQYLDVYLQGLYIGKLCSENATLSFTYDTFYLENPKAIKLSTSLPLQKDSFSHLITFAFFSGLLPDESVRYHLARYLGLSEKNTFGLLKEIGGECAGAVSVYPEGSSPSTTNSTYRILSNHEAQGILSSLNKQPMLAGEEDIRISGAGAQDKLMIALIKGKIAIPTHNSPSTHIIKPPIKDLEEPVQNELFCMKLAKALGLPIPDVYIHYLKDKPFYLIKRYDREINQNNIVSRLHQEDFCQALNIAPEMKYENEGGPTLAQCFKLLDEKIKSGSMAGKNKITLLQAVIFNFLIGNGDAHGKNFSILYHNEAESLTPFYDLMCTLVYSNHFKAKMAMKISGKYKFKDVLPRHFLQLSHLTGFKESFIHKQLKQFSDKITPIAMQLCSDLNNNPKTRSTIYAKIIKIIDSQQQQISKLSILNNDK